MAIQKESWSFTSRTGGNINLLIVRKSLLVSECRIYGRASPNKGQYNTAQRLATNGYLVA